MIKQEDSGDYQERKQARNKWRNVNRIATAARAYAKEMAQDMREAQKAAKVAINKGSDNVRQAVKSALDNQSMDLSRSSQHSISSSVHAPKKEPAAQQSPASPKPTASLDARPKPRATRSSCDLSKMARSREMQGNANNRTPVPKRVQSTATKSSASPAAEPETAKAPAPSVKTEAASSSPLRVAPRKTRSSCDLAKVAKSRGMDKANDRRAGAQRPAPRSESSVSKPAKDTSSGEAPKAKPVEKSPAPAPAPAKAKASSEPVSRAAPRATRSSCDLTKMAKSKAAADLNNRRGDAPRRVQSKPATSSKSNAAPATTSATEGSKPAVKKEEPAKKKPVRARSFNSKPVAKPKTLEELAREKEEADRRAAVERSRQEALQARLEAKLRM